MPTKDRKPLGRGKNLQAALDNIRKDRDLRIGSLGEFDLTAKAISTGNLSIDAITGIGGLPIGRLTELYGLPSSGKTTTALQAAAEAQKMDLVVLYLDYEHALDPEYAEALGVDTLGERFLFAQPETFEEGMNSMRELIETGELGLVIVDSVASMPIAKELAIETGESTFADKAKLMAQTMRQITPVSHKNDVAVVFLNHIQEVIGGMPGVKSNTTPGGRALKFHSSMRIEYTPFGNKKNKRFNPLTGQNEDVITETSVKVRVTKNKLAPPFRTTVARVRYGKGFSNAWSAYEILKGYNLIKKSGSSYSFDETVRPDDGLEKIVGEDNLISALEDNPAWLAKLVDKATSLVSEDDIDVDEILTEPEEDPEAE